MKRIICFIFGHRWKQGHHIVSLRHLHFNGFDEPLVCARCKSNRNDLNRIDETDMYFI